MSERSAETTQDGSLEGRAPERLDERTQRAILASGSIFGAIAMSSCCILPLALFSLGATGAWIGNLAALAPYQPYFLGPTAVFLGLGFFKVYRTPRTAVCGAEARCGSTLLGRASKTALWLASGLTLAALTFPSYAPWLLDD